MQLYVVEVRGELTEAVSRDVQLFIRERGGYILMVAPIGPIVALPEPEAATVARHPLVAFLGPVTLNPRGVAFQHLSEIFARNLSQQLDVADLDETLEQGRQQ
jgi:hypothetical protein